MTETFPFRMGAALLLALLVGAAGADAATAIGKVTRLQGDAEGTVEGVTRPLAVDDAVFLEEAVATGVDARLEVALDDDTVLTVGERSSLKLDAFVYRPDANVVKVTLAGAFRFVSGAVRPGVLHDASVTTPFSVVAVRGTDFWGGPIDNAFGVFLFDGAVGVTNGGATANLTAAGQGVTIDTLASPPGPVIVWAPDKVARAVASVTFR